MIAFVVAVGGIWNEVKTLQTDSLRLLFVSLSFLFALFPCVSHEVFWAFTPILGVGPIYSCCFPWMLSMKSCRVNGPKCWHRLVLRAL
jgi:hypothetical protein